MKLPVLSTLLILFSVGIPTIHAQDRDRFAITTATVAVEASKLAVAEERDWLMMGDAEARAVIDDGSTVALAAEAAISAQRWWEQGYNGRQAACAAARLGGFFGATEILKRAVRRDRPDHSNRLSFPSQHTGAAVLLAPRGARQIAWGVPMALARMLAGKHYLTDTMAGGTIAVGFAFIPC